MKKTIVAITAAVAVMAAGSAAACPEWECQLDLNDYSCGGYHGGGCITQTYQYDEYSVRQPIYCQYCGHEQWDCMQISGTAMVTSSGRPDAVTAWRSSVPTALTRPAC